MVRVADRGRRGMALVIVLFGLAAVAALTVALSNLARLEAHGSGNLAERARLRHAADAGLALALKALTEERPPPGWRFDGTRLETEFDGLALGLRVIDAAALHDLNTGPPERLARLLAETGLPPQQAALAVSALQDWIDADDLNRQGGSEAGLYRADNMGYAPRNAPLESVAEPNMIRNFPRDAYARILPLVTVHGAAPGQVYAVDVEARGEGGSLLRRRSIVALNAPGARRWQIAAQYDLPDP